MLINKRLLEKKVRLATGIRGFRIFLCQDEKEILTTSIDVLVSICFSTGGARAN